MKKQIANTEAKQMLKELAEFIVKGAEYAREYDRNAGTEEINVAWDERSEFETIVIETVDDNDPKTIEAMRLSFRIAKNLIEGWVEKAVTKAQAA